MLDAQIGPGADAVQHQRGQQHRRRRASGNAQADQRNDRSADSGVVGRFRGHHSLVDARAEFLRSLMPAAGVAIGHPGRNILAHARHGANAGADAAPANDVRQIAPKNRRQAQMPAILLFLDFEIGAFHRIDDLRQAEERDRHRHEGNAGQQFWIAEGQAFPSMDVFLPDHRHQNADQAGDPSLDWQIGRSHRAADQYAENREPEKFGRSDLQRQAGHQRGEEQKNRHAEQSADERRHSSQDIGVRRLAVTRQSVAVEAGGRRRAGAGDID
ncbi:MAG: hypothetical protein BWZ10_03357 [candidate division BRC1 bacterium ADurb.BinA364]|nr:MAG: hypothetical protein BWZ10_03357 [candidate division BRC1 bacterium ADurb.BinA364]